MDEDYNKIKIILFFSHMFLKIHKQVGKLSMRLFLLLSEAQSPGFVLVRKPIEIFARWRTRLPIKLPKLQICKTPQTSYWLENMVGSIFAWLFDCRHTFVCRSVSRSVGTDWQTGFVLNKWLKMAQNAQNGFKWLKMVQHNCLKCHKIAPDASKWLHIAQNISKQLQMAPIGSNWLKMDWHGSKWLEIAWNGSKLLEIA